MTEGIRDIMFIEFCICQMFVSSSTGQYTIQTLVVTCYFVFGCNMTMVSDIYFCVIRVSYTQKIQYLNSSESTSYTNADFSHLKCSGNASYIEPDDVSENIYRFTSQFLVEFALLSLLFNSTVEWTTKKLLISTLIILLSMKPRNVTPLKMKAYTITTHINAVLPGPFLS